MAELDWVNNVDELDALTIGSVVRSVHGAVWQRQVSGWASTSGQMGHQSEFVWGTEKGLPRRRRFHILYLKPGPDPHNALALIRRALDGEGTDAT